MEVSITFSILTPCYYLKVSFPPQPSFLLLWLLCSLYFFQDVKNTLSFFSDFFVIFSFHHMTILPLLAVLYVSHGLQLQCFVILGYVVIIALGNFYFLHPGILRVHCHGFQSWHVSEFGPHAVCCTCLRTDFTLWCLWALPRAEDTAQVSRLERALNQTPG